MRMETGRKGRLKVIKSMGKKLKRPMDMDNFMRWLMLKHGYSQEGAKRFVREMIYAKRLKVTTIKKGKERERGIKKVFRLSIIPMRTRKAGKGSSGNQGVTDKK